MGSETCSGVIPSKPKAFSTAYDRALHRVVDESASESSAGESISARHCRSPKSMQAFTAASIFELRLHA